MSSIMNTSGYGGHSAHVSMLLLLNGTSIRVLQMGPDFLFVEAGVEHPPGEASLVLAVDDSERRWKVRLPHGIAAGSDRVTIAVSQ
jgi:hypothetical protein